MNYDEAIRRARLALANSNPGWEEHKHPRRADGKFGSGGGAVGARNEKRKAYRNQVEERMRADLGRRPRKWEARFKAKLASAKTAEETNEAYDEGLNVFLYEANNTLKHYPVPESGEERNKALAERKSIVKDLAKVFGVRVGHIDDSLWDMPKRIAKELDWDVSKWEDDDPEEYEELMEFAKERALLY